MDMREMVDKVKKGEPLYGRSTLSPYMQGVAARNSRYSGIWLHVIPWFNFVNHQQVRLVDWFCLLRDELIGSWLADLDFIAWCGYGQVLSSGRKGIGGGEIGKGAFGAKLVRYLQHRN